MKNTITLMLLLFITFVNGQTSKEKIINHTFLITGNLSADSTEGSLPAIRKLALQYGDRATLVFLGNTFPKNGLDVTNPAARARLDASIDQLKGLQARTLFIPGVNEWAGGVKSLHAGEDYITGLLNYDQAFLPKGGCGLKKITITDKIDLLALDSNWAIMDWDQHPDLNGGCTLKSKQAFYTEIEHEINKSEGKTIIIAMYHSVASQGIHNSSPSFGINPQDRANKYYQEFCDRLITISRQNSNIILLGGNEQNLQYNVSNTVPVIVSGASRVAVGKSSVTDTNYLSGAVGFAVLDIYSDGGSAVSFYSEENSYNKPVFQKTVFDVTPNKVNEEYNEYATPRVVYRSIYDKDDLKHSSLYKKLWGEHYRNDYTTPVKMKAALLDTLYGGLTPVRKGGGHQTNTLRLEDKNGREYAMRNAKKSALRFIQYFLFKNQYLDKEMSDTYMLKLLQDYWTTANPYASLTIADLSDAIDIYHANPQLYYIPRQKALGQYNEDFGDAVYFIEEQPRNGWGALKSFGYSDTIVGTDDVIKKLGRKDKVAINEAVYIRSRLFDNVIGDFDRHFDQWRWKEERLNDGTLYYSPIPRDRDQAFSDFEGIIIGTITMLSPPMRFMQPYSGKYKHIRWYSDAGDDLDRVLLQNDSEEDWVREARFIREHLTDSIVNVAFSKFPEGVDVSHRERIRTALLSRIRQLEQQAKDLHTYLKSRLMITGTNKDDRFVITRNAGGITNIKGYRNMPENGNTPFWNVDYDGAVTREIWLYGLDGNDSFDVLGTGDNLIPIVIVGGRNNDTYTVENKSNLKIYDYKSKPNTFNSSANKILTDNYAVNNYDFMQGRRTLPQTLPILGYNPDSGIGVGLTHSRITTTPDGNPFRNHHEISALYFTSTSGLRMDYSGEFAHVFGNSNLKFEGGFTTPNGTFNYFGPGNNSVYNKAQGIDYNRVKLSRVYLSPSIVHRGYYGSLKSFGLRYENIDIERTQGRYIAAEPMPDKAFRPKNFLSAEAIYSYANFDNEVSPQKGIGFSLTGGVTSNLDDNNTFSYIIPELRLTTRIDKRGLVVFATKIKAKHLFNDNFHFYQAAAIGDGEGLRGFRQQRFSGQSSYFHNSDVRLHLGKLKNGILPVSFGVYGGFDYGRVWISGNDSNTIHTSLGGGLFFNIAGFTTANLAYFNSAEGGRLNIRMQLAF